MTSNLADFFVGLAVRPMTKELVENLIWDRPLTPGEQVDFGVDSADHYRALKAILFDAEELYEDEAGTDALTHLRQRIVELDAALGNGPKLNALVKRYAPLYAERVHFQTTWDLISEPAGEEAEEV